jgi:hypothetical protein
MTGDSPKFAGLDREIHSRENGTNRGDGNMDSRPHIGGSTDDLNRLCRADIDAAHTEFVGIGMLISGQNVADHDPLCLGAEIIDVFHLKPSHRKAFGKVVYRVIHLDQFVQPGQRHQHRRLTE